MHSLQKENLALTAANAQQAAHILSLQANQTDMQRDIQSLKDSVSRMSHSVTHLHHVESGSVYCGDSDHWARQNISGFGLSYTDKTQSFWDIYESPPAVHLSVELAYSDEGDKDDYFYFYVKKVDKYQFTLRCQKYADSAHIKDLRVTWISVPK